MNRRPFVVNRDSDTEHVENHGPSFGRVMAEIRDEIRDFVQTRVQMLRSELQEKISVWKAGAGLAAVAVVLLARLTCCSRFPWCAWWRSRSGPMSITGFSAS